LEAPSNIYGGHNLGSVNSINSIYLAGMDPTSLNVHSLIQNSNNIGGIGGVQKSTSSFTSNGRLLSFAEKLKMAHD
jgi:hypothetical protein